MIENQDSTSIRHSIGEADCANDIPTSAVQRFAVRVRRSGLRRTLTYLLFVVIGEKFGLKIQRQFEFDRDATGPAVELPEQFTFRVLKTVDDLTDEDREFLQSYGEWSAFLDRLSHGRRCLVIHSTEGQLACACWFGSLDEPNEESSSAGIIDHCFTRYEFRGLGLYPSAIRHIAISSDVNIGMQSRRLVIECSRFNHSSYQGIIKAGFVPKRDTLQVLGRTIVSWNFN